MSYFYLDSSALVKRYLTEIGSAWIATALDTQATALAAGLAALTFVAADDNLLAAARAEGLAAENPNLHP